MLMERTSGLEKLLRRPIVGSMVAFGILVGTVVAAIGVGFGGAYLGNAAVAYFNSPAHPAELPELEEDLGPAPLFADWPEKKPDVALVLTGEMYGYMRPCGCSPGQHGGLARRDGFLHYLTEERQWNVLPLELGDLIGKGGMLEPVRYAYIIESLQTLGYPAIGVGVKDLSISVNDVFGQAVNMDSTKLLQSNLQHKDADFQELMEQFLGSTAIADPGGVKVGITSLIGEGLQGKLPDPSVSLRPTDEVMEAVIKKMDEEKVDLRVVLANMPQKEAVALAEKYPVFDVILCESKIEDSATQEAQMVGKTMVTWVGRKGKSVGVVGFWKDEQPHLRFEIVPLDGRFPESDEMGEIYGRFVRAVKDGNFLEKVPRVPHPSHDEFVGAEKCGQCHKKAFAHWKESKHAHALETLHNVKPTGQDHNPECVSCHSTGFGFVSGFVSPELTPTLAGNQCENCHGPGKRHVADPKNPQFAAEMRLSRFTVEQSCVKCHDADNSVHFKFDTYWPKIAHPWRD